MAVQRSIGAQTRPLLRFRRQESSKRTKIVIRCPPPRLLARIPGPPERQFRLIEADAIERQAHVRLDATGASRVSSINRSLLIRGSAEESLDLLPDASVQKVVTSPPYWSLWDYGTSGQIGRDDTLSDYLASLVRTFRKVRRVLVPTGTLWLNIGDSYTSGNRRYRAPDRKNAARGMGVRPPTPDGLKPKDLIGVPWRIALALQEDGWCLGSEVI